MLHKKLAPFFVKIHKMFLGASLRPASPPGKAGAAAPALFVLGASLDKAWRWVYYNHMHAKQEELRLWTVMVICSCVGHWASPGHRMLRGCSLMWQVISIFYKRPVCCSFVDLGGWLVLGRDRGGMAVFTHLPGQLGSVEPFLRCCMWLRGTGMLRMPVLLVDCGLNPRNGRGWTALIWDRVGR